MAWRPSRYLILDGSACRGLRGRRGRPGVRLNWYAPGPGHETRPILAIGANTLYLTCLLLWLCSQVTLLARLFLTLAWFDLRFGLVLSF